MILGFGVGTGLCKQNRIAAGGRGVTILCVCLYGSLALSAQAPRPVEIAAANTPPAVGKPNRSDLVFVRVVVRKAHGNPVAGLRSEDFRLWSDQHPQTIAEFSVEETSPESLRANPDSEAREVGRGPATPTSNPKAHYTALFFDDNHLTPSDLELVRDAADRHLASLPPGERVDIFSASGQVSVGFTDDTNRLREALPQLRAHSRFLKGGYCPDITPYHAQTILEKSDRNPSRSPSL